MTGINFTDDVRRALQIARERATELGNESVTPSHILLGVATRPGSVCTAVLTDLGTDPTTIGDRVAATLAPGKATVSGPDLPYTFAAKRVLEAAMVEARELGHGYVGAEHLLLALLAPRSPLAAMLEQAGLTLAQARAALSSRSPGGPAIPAGRGWSTNDARVDWGARTLALAALGIALVSLAVAMLK